VTDYAFDRFVAATLTTGAAVLLIQGDLARAGFVATLAALAFLALIANRSRT
jgi:hypothetical protein